MRLALFGPPGAGKGTQARLLTERLALTQISTGDLFRAALRDETPVGLKAKSYMDRGALVPDAVVNEMVGEALAAVGYDDFILDGFPRTVDQAAWLDDDLRAHGAPLDAVVSLVVEHEVVVQRLSRRRTDRATGAIYHLDFNPPPPGLPAERLHHRSDDQPDAIRKRLLVYEDETAPVEAFLRERAPYVRVEGIGEIEAVHARILDGLRKAGVRGVSTPA
ncbi:MAG: adenylate kinase [Rhodothermales bacterium]|nr:adenylate kinase [Rhodothermales bacterium]